MMVKIANNFEINRRYEQIDGNTTFLKEELLDDDEWSSCPAKYGKPQL